MVCVLAKNYIPFQGPADLVSSCSFDHYVCIRYYTPASVISDLQCGACKSDIAMTNLFLTEGIHVLLMLDTVPVYKVTLQGNK